MKVNEIPEDEWVLRWPQVRLDQFKNIEMMETEQMNRLNTLCENAEKENSWTHRINSDYRANDSGQHGLGKANDIVFYYHKLGDVPVMDQFKFACESNLFMRVGFYPFWYAPGLHIDIKPETLYWFRDKAGNYHYKFKWEEFLTWPKC